MSPRRSRRRRPARRPPPRRPRRRRRPRRPRQGRHRLGPRGRHRPALRREGDQPAVQGRRPGGRPRRRRLHRPAQRRPPRTRPWSGPGGPRARSRRSASSSPASTCAEQVKRLSTGSVTAFYDVKANELVDPGGPAHPLHAEDDRPRAGAGRLRPALRARPAQPGRARRRDRRRLGQPRRGRGLPDREPASSPPCPTRTSSRSRPSSSASPASCRRTCPTTSSSSTPSRSGRGPGSPTPS